MKVRHSRLYRNVPHPQHAANDSRHVCTPHLPPLPSSWERAEDLSAFELEIAAFRGRPTTLLEAIVVRKAAAAAAAAVAAAVAPSPHAGQKRKASSLSDRAAPEDSVDGEGV